MNKLVVGNLVHCPQCHCLETALIAFIGAILGALYPALKAASKDSIDALSYE
jgi:ABC-type lipoprotein release transport system permease subunit